MYNSINVEIMTRNELKQLWFSLPVSQEEIKTITVKADKNKYWPGYGEVTIMSDGPNGYSCFDTHQGDNAFDYAEKLYRKKEYKGYKLVIK